MEQDTQNRQAEDVLNVIGDIVKNWWVVVCIALAVSLWAYMAAFLLYAPTYTSDTTFVVSAKGSTTGTYANTTKAKKLTDTFQSVLGSQVLQKKVAEYLNLSSFPGQVSIQVLPETNLLTVAVTSDSPELSFRLLKGILANYEEVSKNVLGEVVLETFEEPDFPSGPDVSFQGRAVMKKAFLWAAAFMALLLGIVSYLRDTVKSEEDVNRKLDTTLFGVLGHERAYRNLKARLLRRRKKQLITEPSVGFGFAESIKKMRTKLIYQCEKEKQKVVLVTSTAPREGKTTVAANLALAIAQRGLKVLLIEGDLKRSVLAEVLGARIPEGAGLDKNRSKSGDLDPAIFRPEENLPLYLLANCGPWNKAAEFLGSARFSRFLESWRQRVDYIIIDGPCVRGRADAEVLMRQADLSLLVVRQNQQKIPVINDTVDLLESYGKRVAGCILNHTISRGALFTSGYGYGYGYGYGGYRYGRRYGGYYGGYYYGSYYGAYHRKKSSATKRKKEQKEHAHE